MHSSRQRLDEDAGAHEVHVAGDGPIITQAMSLPGRAKASSSCCTLLYSSTSVCCTTSAAHRRWWVAEGGQARAGLDQQRVGVAVVAALELDDLAAARGAARQADGAHAGLGARADQAHHVHGRMAEDFLGQFDLALGRARRRKSLEAAFCTASSTAGWPWPRIIGPQEPM